tara:strand:- start:2464 stop:2703 length:240 start_codon:yes stop_codon:yes gene_type:complete
LNHPHPDLPRQRLWTGSPIKGEGVNKFISVACRARLQPCGLNKVPSTNPKVTGLKARPAYPKALMSGEQELSYKTKRNF